MTGLKIIAAIIAMAPGFVGGNRSAIAAEKVHDLSGIESTPATAKEPEMERH